MTKPPLRIIREGDAPPTEGRPQDPHLDGRDLKFETLEHGGAEPDTMPNAIRATDPQGRTAIYVLQGEDKMEATTTVPTESESRLADTEQVLHTETPWHATPAEDVGGGIFIGSDDNNAAFVPGFNDHPHNQANAALIVRAVNAHNDMLAALKEMVIWMPSGFAPQSKTRAMQMALDAIAKAEGRAPTPPLD